MNPPLSAVFARRVVLCVSAWLALVAFADAADDWAPNIAFNTAWHSNASLADRSVDQIDAVQIFGEILASRRRELNPTDTTQITARLAGDWWPSYRGLTRGIFGGRAEWWHRFGPRSQALEIGIRGALDGVTAVEYARNGFGLGGLATVRKRFNDFTRATLSYEYLWFDAQRGAFDSNSNEFAVELERDLNPATRVTFKARYRSGDIVSYASGSRPDLVALAKSQLDVTTFERPMTAYRIDANTWSGRVALIHALDHSTALILSYDPYVSDEDSLRLTNHVLAVSAVYQF